VSTAEIKYKNDCQTVYFDRLIENSLVSNYKEEDHKLLLIGINNLVISVIKVETEEISADYLNSILQGFPVGVGVVGVMLVYNDNVYEDFNSVYEELCQALCKASSESKENNLNKLLGSSLVQEHSGSIYYFLCKEVLYQSKLEFEEAFLVSLSEPGNNETKEVQYSLDRTNHILKEHYGFCYSKIELNKTRLLEIMNSENSSSIKEQLTTVKESWIVLDFEGKLLIDYKEFTGNKDKEPIQEVISNAIKIASSEKSPEKDALFSRGVNIKRTDSVSKHPEISSSLNVFNIESSYQIQFKNTSNEFLAYDVRAKEELDDKIEKIEEGENKNGVKEDNSNKIIVSDCFLWDISVKQNFTQNLEVCTNRLINSFDSVINKVKLSNTTIDALGSTLFFNEIVFPCPLLCNPYDSSSIDFLSKSLLLKHSKYLNKNSNIEYPNDHNLTLSIKKPLNVHLFLKPEFSETSKTSYVKGIYEYHHYNQDDFDDDGWGCAYRSLQCLYSWFFHNNILDSSLYPPTPSIPEIQKYLVKAGDKTEKIVGSKDWIGAFEVNIVLNHVFGIESQIMYLTSGSEIKNKAREIAFHFETVGTPIMIGGGVYAYTIVGINYDYTNGECQFLILDPHYKEKDEINVITNKGGIAWKSESLFEKGNFYNLCMPQLPYKD